MSTNAAAGFRAYFFCMTILSNPLTVNKSQYCNDLRASPIIVVGLAGQTHFERRKKRRESADSTVDLIWKDEAGQRRFECGRLIDHSASGAGIGSPEPLAASSGLIVRAPGIGKLAYSVIRSCSWHRTQYHLGVEFVEIASVEPSSRTIEPDFHQLIRAGVAGNSEQVDRLYRTFAFRYHPDNRETGSSEIFLRISGIYQIISSSSSAKPEVGIIKQDFSWRERLRRLQVNCVSVLGELCRKRIDDYMNPNSTRAELESTTGLEPDELGFVLWYLREKGAVTVSDARSDYAISASGVELLEKASDTA